MTRRSSVSVPLPPHNTEKAELGLPVAKANDQQVAILNYLVPLLRHGGTGLIESPTGTGKSTAVLTAAGYALSHKWVERVIVATRTVEQSAALKREWDRACYTEDTPHGKVSAPAARRHYCSNNHAKEAAAARAGVKDVNAVPYNKLDDECKARRMALKTALETLPVLVATALVKAGASAEFASRVERDLEGMGLFHFHKDDEEEDRMKARKAVLEARSKIRQRVFAAIGRERGTKNARLRAEIESSIPFLSSNGQGLQRHYCDKHIADIEELTSGCSSKCKFYSEQGKIPKASLVICTYKYVLDPKQRGRMIQPRSSEGPRVVLIFDEGHNVDGCCRAEYRVKHDVDSVLTLRVVDEEDVLKKRKQCPAVTRQTLLEWERELRAEDDDAQWSTMSLESRLGGGDEPGGNEPEPRSLGDVFLGLFGLRELHAFSRRFIDKAVKAMPPKKASVIVGIPGLDEIAPLYAQLQDSNFVKYVTEGVALDKGPRSPLQVFLKATKRWAGAWDAMLFGWLEAHRKGVDKFELSLVNITDGNKPRRRELELNALVASVVMDEIVRACHGVVLMSGTLSKPQALAHELGHAFEGRLRQPCPYLSRTTAREQFRAFTVAEPRSLDYTFNNLKVHRRLVESKTGQIVLGVIDAVPSGKLFFFPSSNLLKSMMGSWKQSGALDAMRGARGGTVVFDESQEVNAASEEVEKRRIFGMYCEAVKSGKSAALFAVFRGIFSEGADFKGDLSRCVVLFGIPYAPWTDSAIQSKRRFNDKHRHLKMQSGHDWYEDQAFIAYNQAIGRVYRNDEDKGVVLLVDSRWGPRCEELKNKLSPWVRERLEPLRDVEMLRQVVGEMRLGGGR